MNWLTYLKPQLEEHLRELCFNGYYADDVQDILEDDNWLQDEQFRYRVFNYGKAEWTLQGLLDTMFLLIGHEGVEAIKGTLRYTILELTKHAEFQRPSEDIELEEEVA